MRRFRLYTEFDPVTPLAPPWYVLYRYTWRGWRPVWDADAGGPWRIVSQANAEEYILRCGGIREIPVV